MASGKILVAQGGGPTAVINQSLAGVVLEARRFGEVSRVYGARHGVRGKVTSSSSTIFSKSLIRISTRSCQRPATGMRKSPMRQKPPPSLTPWRCIGSMPKTRN